MEIAAAEPRFQWQSVAISAMELSRRLRRAIAPGSARNAITLENHFPNANLTTRVWAATVAGRANAPDRK